MKGGRPGHVDRERGSGCKARLSHKHGKSLSAKLDPGKADPAPIKNAWRLELNKNLGR